MLNWIAIWVGVWPFGLGGPLQSNTDPSVPVSTTSWRAPSCRCSGAIRSSRACTSACSSRWRRGGVLGDPQPHGLGLRVRAVGFNPTRRAGGISVGGNYVLVMLICGRSPAWPERSTCWLADPGRDERRRSLRDRFPWIRRGAARRNMAVGTTSGAAVRCCWLLDPRSATSISLSFERSWPALARRLIIQGLIVLFVDVGYPRRLPWRLRRKLRGKSAAPDDPAVQVAA